MNFCVLLIAFLGGTYFWRAQNFITFLSQAKKIYPAETCACHVQSFFFSYEIPYRGVSEQNPTGHLLLALRNKGVTHIENDAFADICQSALCSESCGRTYLHGLLALIPWQLVFVPCVNPHRLKPADVPVVRSSIMQSLRRTEPGFLHSWASGFSGAIPFAKIDHLLAVDRNRMYRYNPHRSTWIPTNDNFKRRRHGDRLSSTLTRLPFTPSRLVICTTDFEVYVFCPFLSITLSHHKESRSNEAALVWQLHSFISELCRVVSHARNTSGLELASLYASRSDTKCVRSASSSDQSEAPPVNPFAFHEMLSPVSDSDEVNKPINHFPVHPNRRVDQIWFTNQQKASRSGDWIENQNFSYCRTYPLKLPCVVFTKPLLEVCKAFESHRFPVLSCSYPPVHGASSVIRRPSVHLLRSGWYQRKKPLHEIIDCKQSNSHLVHIRVISTGDLGDMLVDKSSGPSDEATQWFLPGLETTQSASNHEGLTSVVDWLAPRHKLLRKSWTRLGNLLRLPQTYSPFELSVKHKKKYSFKSKCTPSVQLSEQLAESPDLSTFENDVNYKGSESQSKPWRTSHMAQWKPDVHTKSDLTATTRIPHRSGWQDLFVSTRWPMLITLCLKQASQLAELIVRYDRMDSSRATMVVLSGPGSGRVWQPILISLTQIILLPHARTLSGFEDIIEREWVRLGYPFSPDPSDWFDSSVPDEYEEGASFGLFLDCVHQLMYQYPTEFAFTEDYLVLLLNCALSRGGGLPPFAIEFSCSCEAARRVSPKAKSSTEVDLMSDRLFRTGALRSFHHWPDVLTTAGLGMLGNWCYYWLHCAKAETNANSHAEACQLCSHQLSPITSPPWYIRCWIHGLFRWHRSLRIANGGGYAFEAAHCRTKLGPKLKFDQYPEFYRRPKTSSSPYTGWMSDEAIQTALSLWGSKKNLEYEFLSQLFEIVANWEHQLISE